MIRSWVSSHMGGLGFSNLPQVICFSQFPVWLNLPIILEKSLSSGSTLAEHWASLYSPWSSQGRIHDNCETMDCQAGDHQSSVNGCWEDIRYIKFSLQMQFLIHLFSKFLRLITLYINDLTTPFFPLWCAATLAHCWWEEPPPDCGMYCSRT